MAVNNVQAIQQPQQMSRGEHLFRTFSFLGLAAPVYDIGKALSEGKGFGEAYDVAANNRETVQARNKEALAESYNKTVEQFKDMPWYGKLLPGATAVGLFVKNLFE